MVSNSQSALIGQKLQEAGYKLTKPRLAVLQVLQENDKGLNPKEIHQLGKEIYPSMGLVSVYRTLDLLTELRLVTRVHSEHQCHSYASALSNRHYVICNTCYRVFDFPCQGLDELINRVQEETGFTVTEHLLELNGLCPDC